MGKNGKTKQSLTVVAVLQAFKVIRNSTWPYVWSRVCECVYVDSRNPRTAARSWNALPSNRDPVTNKSCDRDTARGQFLLLCGRSRWPVGLVKLKTRRAWGHEDMGVGHWKPKPTARCWGVVSTNVFLATMVFNLKENLARGPHGPSQKLSQSLKYITCFALKTT